MNAAIPTVEASATTVNVASELTFGRIIRGAEMTRNLRVSKASKHTSVSVTFRGKDFRMKSVTYAVRLLK
jgi:hypothetical protein